VFGNREEAEEAKARLLADLSEKDGKTIGGSLDEYRSYRINFRGVKPYSADEHTRHLRALLPLDWPIISLTPEKAEGLYMAYADSPNKRNGKPLSPNTHHWVLLVAKCWAKWCVKMGYLPKSPFAAVEPKGKLNAGKPQHTVDEAQRFNTFLLERTAAGDHAAVGVLLMLHLGLRKGEVAARVSRDLDADGTILIIPFGKTESSRRRVKVPQWLQPILKSMTKGKAPADRIFTVEGRATSGGYWWRKVQEYCEQAGVPKVCPHSLRGLHATLAIEEGATSEAVARALGHTSFAMTAKHYASADSVVNARLARAGQLLTPSIADHTNDPVEHVLALASLLTSEQRKEVRRRLA
jgi:integrase